MPSSPRSPAEVLALLREAASEPDPEVRRWRLTLVHAEYVRLHVAWVQAERDFADWTAQYSKEKSGGA